MSNSRCPSCGKTGFEIATEEPNGSSFKLNILRCSSCYTAIGVLDYYNIGALIRNFAKKSGINLD